MKRLISIVIPVIILMTGLLTQGASAQQTDVLKVAQNPSLGAIFTDSSDRTVYLFTADTTANQSTCNADCSTTWPPVLATAGMTLPAGVPGTLTTINRSDGKMQVAYNGIPLYYFAGDSKTGDTNGQGVGGVWFVVSPGATFGPYPPPVGKGTPVPASTLKVGFTTADGPFLTDSTGKTLYIFQKDTAGTSTCTGDCATEWPPLAMTSAMTLPVGIGGTLGMIIRADGSMQVTYNGMPLYSFKDDKNPGDATGQNQDDFVVASVSGSASAGTPVSSPSAQTSAPPATAAAATNANSAAASSAIQIQNFAFTPNSMTVKAGTTVTWTNADSTTHTVTADDGSFDSGNLAPGKTFSFTFNTPGTHTYHCAIHTYMTATIVVQ